jgi:phosphatidate cytidylyltransferase
MPDEKPTTAAPKKSKSAVFLQRLISTVVLWAIIIAAMFSGNAVSDWCFLGIMLALTWTGLMEFYDMTEKRGLRVFRQWGIFGGLLLIGSTFFYLAMGLGANVGIAPAKAGDFETGIIVIWALGLCLLQIKHFKDKDAFTAICTTFFGLIYVAWLLNFIQKINYFPQIDDSGPYYVLYFILVTKFSDLGGYCAGSLFGRHKACPNISPGKTWEGFTGAVVISMAASVVFVHFLQHKMHGMKIVHAVILGAILGLAAIIGDLIESVFKRGSGVKDSGSYFPGIGGILDLLDSLLFNAPLMYLYLRHILTD